MVECSECGKETGARWKKLCARCYAKQRSLGDYSSERVSEAEEREFERQALAAFERESIERQTALKCAVELVKVLAALPEERAAALEREVLALAEKFERFVQREEHLEE